MREWFTITELSAETNIPHQTLRRYITSHKELLRLDKKHKVYRLHEECIKTLIKIRELYGQGKIQEEINEELSSLSSPTSSIEIEVLNVMKSSLDKQEKFNNQLLKLMREQQNLLREHQKNIVQQQKYIEEILVSKNS